MEFLNEKMTDVEVLAVEIKQFLGKGKDKVIVPRVVGFTETAREMKASSGMRASHTNREEFLSKCDPDAAQVFEHLLEKADEFGHTIYWGTVGFSIRYKAQNSKNASSFMYGYPPDIFQFYLGQLGFGEENNNRIRKELMATRLFKAGGKWTLSVNVKATNTEQVIQTIDHAFEMIKEELDRKSYKPSVKIGLRPGGQNSRAVRRPARTKIGLMEIQDILFHPVSCQFSFYFYHPIV